MAIEPSTQSPVPPRPGQTPVSGPAPVVPTKTSNFLAYLFLGTSKPGEIVIYRHSNLFYWWPVWAFGFLMAIITYFSDQHMAIVPAGTTPTTASEGSALVDGKPVDLTNRDILLIATNKHHLQRKDSTGQERIVQPTIYVAPQKSVGTVFLFILMVVIAITNMHMRGIWSFYILLVLVLLAVVFAAAGWWENIFSGLGQLTIHINMGGYLLLSSVLFVLWLVNFTVFDRQTYVIFNPGQVRMRLEIGGGETVYDTSGMVIQKQRSDLFRHWVLGFGSGDLVIRPNGVSQAIELPNVLNVGRKVRQIETLVKEKVVVAQR